jgi:feruloyl esterase
MGHCGGGDGPNDFDKINALNRWVEMNEAPLTLTASQRVDGKVTRTRPLCPFPQVAMYKGLGSVDDAANFSCRAQ